MRLASYPDVSENRRSGRWVSCWPWVWRDAWLADLRGAFWFWPGRCLLWPARRRVIGRLVRGRVPDRMPVAGLLVVFVVTFVVVVAALLPVPGPGVTLVMFASTSRLCGDCSLGFEQ
jgi:hypothetical protein